jgi:transposase
MSLRVVYRWFECKYDKPARPALLKLIERASQSTLEPLQRLSGTLSRWFEPISRYIRHRYSNGIHFLINSPQALLDHACPG